MLRSEISLLENKIPVLPGTHPAERGIPLLKKSYCFFQINNQKGHLLLYNYVTPQIYERRCP